MQTQAAARRSGGRARTGRGERGRTGLMGWAAEMTARELQKLPNNRNTMFPVSEYVRFGWVIFPINAPISMAEAACRRYQVGAPGTVRFNSRCVIAKQLASIAAYRPNPTLPLL